MQLEKIISISKKPGLYKLVSQLKNGFIVEDVTTKKKLSIGNNSQVSLLDNIAIYTVDTEVPLFSVFESIAKENNYKETISHKSTDAELRDFMEKTLPNYDKGRVYVSDIKKLVQWYNILHVAGYITKESFVKPNSENNSGSTQLEIPVLENKVDGKKTNKTATPKVKDVKAKSNVKSTQRKQG